MYEIGIVARRPENQVSVFGIQLYPWVLKAKMVEMHVGKLGK